jgi:putative acetyltransferase
MFEIRAEEDRDRERVHEIVATAFERRNEADLVENLRRSADPTLSLVAQEEGRILGHVFFSPVEIEGAAETLRVAGLAPLAVDPAHQGRGVGSALVRAGVAACPALGWQAVFLVGNPAYYSRFGFRLALPMGFTYGDPHMDAALQVMEGEAGVLSGVKGGRVRYHPAFADAE